TGARRVRLDGRMVGAAGHRLSPQRAPARSRNVMAWLRTSTILPRCQADSKTEHRDQPDRNGQNPQTSGHQVRIIYPFADIHTMNEARIDPGLRQPAPAG